MWKCTLPKEAVSISSYLDGVCKISSDLTREKKKQPKFWGQIIIKNTFSFSQIIVLHISKSFWFLTEIVNVVLWLCQTTPQW